MAKATAKKPTPVEKKLVSVADTVITAADRSRDPALSIPVRSLANVNFNEKRGIIEMGKRKQERTLFNVGMAKKFMQTVLVADALHRGARVHPDPAMHGGLRPARRERHPVEPALRR